jgi:hypothetical protein
MRKLLSPILSVFFSVLLLFPFSSKAQIFQGSSTVSGANNMTIDITVNTLTNEVDLTLTGPSNLWFAYGFGGSVMSNRYIVLTDGSGNISERKLGNHASGTQLANSLISSSSSVNGSIRTTTVKRSITGMNNDYFTFPGTSGAITLIWARGTGASLAYHGSSNKGSAVIMLNNACNIPVTSIGDTAVCKGESVSIFGQLQTQAGLYYDTLQASSGCDSVLSFELLHELVDTSVQVVDDTTLMANAANASFQWFDCDSNMTISGATNSTFSSSTSGNYSVIVTSANGCVDTSSCYLISPSTGIENALNEFVSIYPNPTNGQLHIQSDNIFIMEIEIYDVMGRRVRIEDFNASDRISLDLKDIKSGLYFMQIHSQEGNIKKVFYKE